MRQNGMKICTCSSACVDIQTLSFRQVDTAQAGKRGKFSRWLARYKRRMDFKMLAIGDGEQPLLQQQSGCSLVPVPPKMCRAAFRQLHLKCLAGRRHSYAAMQCYERQGKA